MLMRFVSAAMPPDSAYRNVGDAVFVADVSFHDKPGMHHHPGCSQTDEIQTR